jgi:hypothetical protein
MIPASHPQQGFSMPLIEGGLTMIALVAAACWPGFLSGVFCTAERALGSVARHKRLAVVIPGIAVLLLRLAMLPVLPIPLPFVPDDFSFLLAGDTFASGKLTNPTPAMWVHFESIHITMVPSYMSMYFPAQGLFLAFGKLYLGHPWFGVLLSDVLMCSAICWMLQAWLPPKWAFLGAMLAVLRLGLFSYWINTYSAGGMIAALGGALVLGALPRYMRWASVRNGMLLASGIVLLAMCRPYEGVLLCLPVAFLLAKWLVGKSRPSYEVLVRSAALPALLLAVAASWMAHYDQRAFGNPLTLPYTVDRATYATAPYYVWQSPRPEPLYHHAVLRDFYANNELKAYQEIHKPSGFIPQTLIKVVRVPLFFAGFALLVPLIMAPRVLRDRRMRFLVVCVLVLAPGMLIEIFLIPHYLAPFTALFYAIGLQCMRHLRVWEPGGRPVGMALVRASVALCVVLAAIRLCTGPLHIVVGEWPASNWSGMWYGPEHYGTERAAVEDKLLRASGRQLVLVRYSGGHNPLDEWVYNSPNIDNSKVIWAREMDGASNAELIRYYHDRHVWLVEPDVERGKLCAYPGADKITGPMQLAGGEDGVRDGSGARGNDLRASYSYLP